MTTRIDLVDDARGGAISAKPQVPNRHIRLLKIPPNEPTCGIITEVCNNCCVPAKESKYRGYVACGPAGGVPEFSTVADNVQRQVAGCYDGILGVCHW
jgi:hypothetical protein